MTVRLQIPYAGKVLGALLASDQATESSLVSAYEAGYVPADVSSSGPYYVRLLVPYAGKATNQLFSGSSATLRALIDAGQADNQLSAASDYASVFSASAQFGIPANALLSPIDGRVLLSPIDGRILLRAS